MTLLDGAKTAVNAMKASEEKFEKGYKEERDGLQIAVQDPSMSEAPPVLETIIQMVEETDGPDKVAKCLEILTELVVKMTNVHGKVAAVVVMIDNKDNIVDNFLGASQGHYEDIKDEIFTAGGEATDLVDNVEKLTDALLDRDGQVLQLRSTISELTVDKSLLQSAADERALKDSAVTSTKKTRYTMEFRQSFPGTAPEKDDDGPDEEVSNNELLDEAHEAASLSVKDILRSKSNLAKTVAYIPDLILSSTSHPEVSLFRWFSDLTTTVPIATKMCLGYLKMLGPKMSGTVQSNHRLALESTEVRAATESAQTAFAKLTRLHLIAASKEDDLSSVTDTKVREAMIEYISIMFERSEIWKSQIIIACIPDPWRVEKNAWSLRPQGKDESAAGFRDYIDRQMRVCRYLGKPLESPCGHCQTTMMLHKINPEAIRWARLNRPEELISARQSNQLTLLFSLVRLWEVQCLQSRSQKITHNPKNSHNSFTTSRPRHRHQQFHVRAITAATSNGKGKPAAGKGGSGAGKLRIPLRVAGNDGITHDTGTNTCWTCDRAGHYQSRCPSAKPSSKGRKGSGSGGKGRATTRSAGQIVKTSKGGKGKFGGKKNSSDRNSRKGNSNTRNVFHIQVSEDGDATGSANDGPIWYDAPKGDYHGASLTEGDYHGASLTEENVTNVTLEEADPSPGEWITPTKKTAKKVPPPKSWAESASNTPIENPFGPLDVTDVMVIESASEIPDLTKTPALMGTVSMRSLNVEYRSWYNLRSLAKCKREAKKMQQLMEKVMGRCDGFPQLRDFVVDVTQWLVEMAQDGKLPFSTPDWYKNHIVMCKRPQGYDWHDE